MAQSFCGDRAAVAPRIAGGEGLGSGARVRAHGTHAKDDTKIQGMRVCKFICVCVWFQVRTTNAQACRTSVRLPRQEAAHVLRHPLVDGFSVRVALAGSTPPASAIPKNRIEPGRSRFDAVTIDPPAPPARPFQRMCADKCLNTLLILGWASPVLFFFEKWRFSRRGLPGETIGRRRLRDEALGEHPRHFSD